MSAERYEFEVMVRAVPAPNNRLERLPKVHRWYQVVRLSVYDVFGVIEVETKGKYGKLGAPFRLGKGDRAEIEAWFFFRSRASADGVNLLKALEDSLFREDRDVLDGRYHVRRGQKKDRVRVRLVIHRGAPK